jgi:hypothetical protein
MFISHSDGQTPWPHGRPSDTDNISTTGRNFRNIVFFREKYRKGVHQNIDQKADIWSEPSQGSKFWRKKNISTMNFLVVEMLKCRNFLCEGGKMKW